MEAFGGGEEYARREPFPSLGDQPHEDLGVQPAFAHGNDALHPGFERLGADGVEEHRQQLDLTAAPLHPGMGGEVIDDAVAAELLGDVAGDVGGDLQVGHGGGDAVGAYESDARGHRQVEAVVGDGVGQDLGADLARERLVGCILARPHPAGGEFVGIVVREHGLFDARGNDLFHEAGDVAQDTVPRLVAAAVIDGGEVVEIDGTDPDAAGVVLLQEFAERFVEVDSAVQAGERVVFDAVAQLVDPCGYGVGERVETLREHAHFVAAACLGAA